MSSGCPLALHAAAEGLVIPKLALFEPPIQGNETPTGESDFTRELAALVTAGRRREAVERQWLLLALPDRVVPTANREAALVEPATAAEEDEPWLA